jgi:protein TonB
MGLGSLLGAAPPPPPPPKVEAPKPVTPSRIRVGGNVQAANLIKQVKPPYPPLAKQARIQGVVHFTAVIGKDGTIQNLTLVSGHPLLVAAAQEAVKQWVYKPTLLNGEPVEVITQIDVNFTLSQ